MLEKTILLDFFGTLAHVKTNLNFVDEICKELRTSKIGYIRFFQENAYIKNWDIETIVDKLLESFGESNRQKIKQLLQHPIGRTILYGDVQEFLIRVSEDSDIYIVSDTSSIGKKCLISTGLQEQVKGCYFSFKEEINKKNGLYSRILSSLGLNPRECIVIGNSYQSDFLPAKELGARAILIDRKGTLNKREGVIKSLEELR